MIVVAGDPENYAAAFAQAPRLLKPHAAIVFTDVLAFDSATSAGGVLNPANRDAKSIAMRELLETVESDERFVTALTRPALACWLPSRNRPIRLISRAAMARIC